MSKAKRSAFTLVEVLIVVVIMAVLAATIIPQFSGATDDAKVGTTEFNLHTLRAQIELYKSQHEGRKPGATLVELTAKTNLDGTTTGSPSYGPYIREIPDNSISGSNNVETSSASPITTATSAGGWLYNASTGEIRINHADHIAK